MGTLLDRYVDTPFTSFTDIIAFNNLKNIAETAKLISLMSEPETNANNFFKRYPKGGNCR